MKIDMSSNNKNHLPYSVICSGHLAMIVVTAFVTMLLCSCNKQEQPPAPNEIYYIQGSKVPEDMSLDSLGMSFIADNMPQCLNSVSGHDERDLIVGKFDGKHTDTLRVERRAVSSDDTTQGVEFFAVSSRRTIPEVKLHGTAHRPPKLVLEGDLDGNGTDEWGYLATGVSSHWRTYRVFTLVKNKWRYLVKNDRLQTPEWFRCSGLEILEKSGRKGYVKINYGIGTIDDGRVLDTVVKVSFAKITD